MIVELVTEGPADGPLIRIYGTNLRDFVEFREITRFLGNEPGRSVGLRSRPAFAMENLADIRMTNSGPPCLVISGGVAEWSLNRSEWHLVSLLTEGLIDLSEQMSGHQWLAGPDASWPLDFGDIPVLLSKSELGAW